MSVHLINGLRYIKHFICAGRTFWIVLFLSLTLTTNLWPEDDAAQSSDPDPLRPPVINEPSFPDRSYNVRDFGATGDGSTPDSDAVNTAIKRCHDEGGGSVVFPEGNYLLASVRLLSNVRLLLDEKAVITGAKTGYLKPPKNPNRRYQDHGHSHFVNAILFGEDVENVAIIGGTINGGGAKRGRKGGDKIIAIRVGRNLVFRDIIHEDGAHFHYLLNDCENVIINRVKTLGKIKTHDGVNLMGCRNVAISECHFTGLRDDAVGIKSDYALGRKIASSNIAIWNSYFESGCNGIQFGSETAGDFSDIRVWDVTIGKAGKAGIGITCNDGGIIDGVEYQNITMKHVTHPIFMIVTDRLRTGEPDATVGQIRNVRIRNLTSIDSYAPHPITLSGRPDSILENIHLDNIRIAFSGNGKAKDTEAVPPYPKNGYQPRKLKTRPAAGLFARHVNGLTLSNVEFIYDKPDQRSPLVIWHAADVVITGFSSPLTDGVDMIYSKNAKNLRISNSPALTDGD